MEWTIVPRSSRSWYFDVASCSLWGQRSIWKVPGVTEYKAIVSRRPIFMERGGGNRLSSLIRRHPWSHGQLIQERGMGARMLPRTFVVRRTLSSVHSGYVSVDVTVWCQDFSCQKAHHQARLGLRACRHPPPIIDHQRLLVYRGSSAVVFCEYDRRIGGRHRIYTSCVGQ